MVKAEIDEAKKGNVDLKIPTDELLGKLERDKDFFEEVKEPKLVHWDCWDGFQRGYGLEMLTDKQLRRALWYDIYFMILAASECEYRQYETMDMYHWSTDILVRQFSNI